MYIKVQFSPLVNAKIHIFYKTDKKKTDYPRKRRYIYIFFNLDIAFMRQKSLFCGKSVLSLKSLAIVVIHHDNHLLAWHEGLNLEGQATDESGIVVNGDVGDDIDR